MSFDINRTLEDMLGAIKEVVEDDWDNIRGYAREILDGEKETFVELSERFIRGEITEEELASELKDEKDTVGAQFKALNVRNKAAIQRAANKALDILYDAIKVAL